MQKVRAEEKQNMKTLKNASPSPRPLHCIRSTMEENAVGSKFDTFLSPPYNLKLFRAVWFCVCLRVRVWFQHNAEHSEAAVKQVSTFKAHFIYKDKFYFVFPFLMSKWHSHHSWKTGPLSANRAQLPGLAAELAPVGESAES